MGELFSPRCFLSISFFFLTILTIYGIVGVVLNIFESKKFHDLGDWPFNLHPLFYAFIGIQGLFPIAGIFAILSTCRKQPLFLYGSGSILLAIFTCASVFGIVSFRPTAKDISDGFYTALKNVGNNEMLNYMNDVQWKYKCCGVYSYADWTMVNYSADLLKTGSVPRSCCKREGAVPDKDCGNGVFSLDNSTQVNQLIYSKGCEQDISLEIKEVMNRLGFEICVVGGVALLIALFLYVGVSKIYLEPGNIFNENNDDASSTAPSRSPTTATRMRTRSSNSKKAWSTGSSRIDSANNNVSVSGNRLVSRDSNGNRKRRQKGKPSKFSSNELAQSKTNMSPRYKRSLRRDANFSKSFILGEAHSHLKAALNADAIDNPDIFRKNVDMLWYQSLDKNASAISTTPNDISSMNFPSSWQNKKSIFSPELMNAINEERNTVYTLVSERPFTPSLSQNCSISFFNNYPMKVSNGNGMESTTTTAATGQNSPHFSNTKQQRSMVHSQSFCPNQVKDEEMPSLPVATEEPRMESDVIPPQPSQIIPPIPEVIEAQKDVQIEVCSNTQDDSDNSSNESLINQMNVAVANSAPSSNANSVKYPTSSVRSSTLATIHEESESTKGTPSNAKGASPASGYMTPENVSPRSTEAKLVSSTMQNCLNTEDQVIAELSSRSGQDGEQADALEKVIDQSVTELLNSNDANAAITRRAIRVGQQGFTGEGVEDRGESFSIIKPAQLDTNMNDSFETLAVESGCDFY